MVQRGRTSGALGGGQSPALQSPLPTPLDSGLRGNDDWGAGLTKGCREWRMRGCWSSLSRIGVRDMLSYQSPMPAVAGTPRCEKPKLCFGMKNWHGGFCHAPPRPQRGTSPRATFSHSAIGLQFGTFPRGEPASRLIEGHIPDRSPGHAFVRMTIREISEIPRHHRSRVTLFSYQ